MILECSALGAHTMVWFDSVTGILVAVFLGSSGVIFFRVG